MQFFKVNEAIRSRVVRVILHDGQQLGILPIKEALLKAKEFQLDLVEIAPTASPPVCKITDFGKFRYDLVKKEKQARKNQHVITTKTICFNPGIGENDLNRKISEIQKFLEKGCRVQVHVVMKRRQNSFPELAMAIIKKVQEATGLFEKPTRQDGKISMILSKVSAE